MILSLDGSLSGFEFDLEALGSLEDDVSLEPEVFLLHARLNTEVPEDRRQENLQLEHGVFATDARSGSRRERHECVVMTVRGLLGQEVVGVEDIRVRIYVRLAVHLDGADYDGASSRHGVIAGSLTY